VVSIAQAVHGLTLMMSGLPLNSVRMALKQLQMRPPELVLTPISGHNGQFLNYPGDQIVG
tara:strand:+ start:1576 stop:1755 length:180 start_codon:yes stop_codon:yes gene_type:complete